jgi:plasmid replication initiation protein
LNTRRGARHHELKGVPEPVALYRIVRASGGGRRAGQPAIAVAQQQKARSFELRAALSLAKLYQSTGRAAYAHAVLLPALEGFAPTPEFPEIEEAQRLLCSRGS